MVAPATRLIATELVPSPGQQDLVEAFMKAARAVGYPVPSECEGNLHTRALKGMSREAYQEADLVAAPRRARCVDGAVKWLR